MENVFSKKTGAKGKQRNCRCPMDGVGDEEKYYLKDIEKLYTPVMPHAFTGCIDPECCAKRLEKDEPRRATAFSNVGKKANLTSIDKNQFITPSKPLSTPSTFQNTRTKNMPLPSTPFGTSNVSMNVTNKSSQPVGAITHEGATVQKLPEYTARILGIDANTGLRAIKLLDGGNSYVQCVYNDCGNNIRESLSDEEEDSDPRPPIEISSSDNDEVIFVEVVDDPRAEDRVVSTMLQRSKLDSPNEQVADGGAVSNRTRSAQNHGHVLHTVRHNAQPIQTPRLSLLKISNDPEGASPRTSFQRKPLGNPGEQAADCKADYNRTRSADNQEHVPRTGHHNVQPIKTPRVTVPKKSDNSEGSLEREMAAIESIYRCRPIELRDDDGNIVQCFNDEASEHVYRQFFNDDGEITIPPRTFGVETDNQSEEDPVAAAMRQPNALQNIHELIALNIARFPHSSEHNEQAMQTPSGLKFKESGISEGSSPLEKTTTIKGDRGDSLNPIELNDNVDSAQSDQDCGISVIKGLKGDEEISNLRPNFDDFEDETIFVEETDDPREEDPVLLAMLRTNTLASTSQLIEDYEMDSNEKQSMAYLEHVPQSVEHKAHPSGTPNVPLFNNSDSSEEEIIFVEETDDPREEDPVLLAMLRTHTLASTSQLIEDYEMDSNEKQSMEYLEHVPQSVEHKAHPSGTPNVPLFNNSDSSEEEIIFVEETDDPREEDPVLLAMLRTNTLASTSQLIEDYEMDSNEKQSMAYLEHVPQSVEHKAHPSGTPNVPLFNNSDSSEDEIIFVEETDDPREEDPVLLAMLRTNTLASTSQLIEDYEMDSNEKQSMAYLEHVPQSVEHKAHPSGTPSVPLFNNSDSSEEEIIFVEETDDPREEDPVLLAMLRTHTLASTSQLIEDYEMDSNVSQMVTHNEQPTKTSSVRGFKSSVNSDASVDPMNCGIFKLAGNRTLAYKDTHNLCTLEVGDDGELYVQSAHTDSTHLDKDGNIIKPPVTIEENAVETICVEEIDDPREEVSVVTNMFEKNTLESVDELIKDNGADNNGKLSTETQEHVLQPVEQNMSLFGMFIKAPSVPVLTSSVKPSGTSRRKQSMVSIPKMNSTKSCEHSKQTETQVVPVQSRGRSNTARSKRAYRKKENQSEAKHPDAS